MLALYQIFCCSWWCLFLQLVSAKDTSRCQGFFSIFILRRSEKCEDIFKARANHLNALSLQFRRYINVSGLTVFVAEDTNYDSKSSFDSCLAYQNSNNPWNVNIKLVKFRQSSLLDESDIPADLRSEILGWPSQIETAARRSDIYRLLIAKKDNLAYIDLDVVLLSKSAETYLSPFVAVTVFHKGQAPKVESALSSLSALSQERIRLAARRFNLEFSNCAFCLSPKMIGRLLSHQLGLVAAHRKNDSGLVWSFVELGSGTFRSVILSNTLQGDESFALLSTNTPKEFSLPSVIEQVKTFMHSILHLTGFADGMGKHAIQSKQFGTYDSFVNEIFRSVGNISQQESPGLEIEPSTAKSREDCKNGLFTTLDSVLAGPFRTERADCCYEMKSHYFRTLLTEAARQAAILGTSLTIYINSDRKGSLCGKCFFSMFQSWKAGYVNKELAFPPQEPFDPLDPQLSRKQDVFLSRSISSNVLRIQSFDVERLFMDCGLDRTSTEPFVTVAATTFASMESLQIKSVNESRVVNTLALETVEALTSLCLAQQYGRAYVALNVLLLDADGQSRNNSNAARGSRLDWRFPFLAVGSRSTLEWEANFFITGLSYCASSRVAQAAAQWLLKTSDDLCVLAQSLAQNKASMLRRKPDMRKTTSKKKSNKYPGQLSVEAAANDTSVELLSLKKFLAEGREVESHEELIANALQSIWIGNFNRRDSSQLPQLVSLPALHISSLKKVLSDLRLFNHSLCVVTPSMVEDRIRLQMREAVYQKQGISVVEGKVKRTSKRSIAIPDPNAAQEIQLIVKEIRDEVRGNQIQI